MIKILENVENEIKRRKIPDEEISKVISSIPHLVNRRIIMGYASVSVIDRENQKISLQALRDAALRFMKEDRYRLISIFHCLDSDTEILACKKGNKYIPIKDINVGDKVYSHTGNLRKVNNVYKYPYNGLANKLYLSNNQEIIITDEHPVLTRDRGWVKAKDLMEEDVLLHCKINSLSEMGKKGGSVTGGKIKGKKFEEIFGLVKASEIKGKMRASALKADHTISILNSKKNKGLTLSQIYGESKAKEILLKIMQPRNGYTVTERHNSRQRKGKTWIELYGHKRPNYGGSKGENNPMWKGGISGLPYDFNFSNQKNKVRLRDNYTCQLCNKSENEEILTHKQKLTVHHINYNKLDSSDTNLITLCKSCNGKVNYKRTHWENYFKIEISKRLQLTNGIKITKISKVWYTGTVFNLEVDIDKTYLGRGIVFHNSDAVVGRVIPKWTDPNTGKIYRTEVDDLGFKIVCELRDDIELSNKVWDEILKGNLRSFSVAGTSKKKHDTMQSGTTFTEIDEMDLLEITICSVPVNPMSKFEILNQPNKVTI